jgi:hypothetical protein
MADHPARDGQISRRSWLLAGLAVSLSGLRGESSLTVTFDGDTLHVSSPTVHFLTGKPLMRLKDGATVVFLSQITLYSDAYVTVLRRPPVERFIVSYNIWEDDKFSVTSGLRSASNLSLAATEAWCQESLTINTVGVGPDQPFWLQLDLRPTSPKELSSVLNGSWLSLGKLIELFGRKPGADEPQSWRVGPLRLHDLVRTTGRGNRNG